MKFSSAAAVSALASTAAAFPAVNVKVPRTPMTPAEQHAPLNKRLNGINPGFDASKQYISTTGQYAWVAPGPTDQRGPCPGLNAFANHGYLPHNGIATIQQFIDATTLVVGMGEDLATFLSVYGAIFDGDLSSWSIGGPDSRVSLPGFNQPQGISGSHNKYEADVSPTRGDLYQYGNDYLVVTDQAKQQYATQAGETDETSNYDIGVLTGYRVTRFQQSVSENPYFFNNFFSGVLVQPAAFTFQYRFMANHSEEYPEGRYSQSNYKDWFSLNGTYPDLTYTPGYERIPDNWYRRAFGDEYTIPYFLQDVVGMAAENPQFLDVGGNTGEVNTFTPIDFLNFTGGLYNAQDLANPTTLGCFFYEFLQQQAPDIIEQYSISLTEALTDLLGALGGFGSAASCQQLQKISNSQFNSTYAPYPGMTQLSVNGQYPNSKGYSVTTSS